MKNWQVQGEFKALHASAEVRAVTDSVKDYAIFLLDPQGIRNYGGMGLGLFISRHIVEAHGGTISMVSHVGEGATFVVELPSRPTAAAGEQEHLKARA